MSIKAIYQETPESTPVEWVMDYDSATVGEVMDLERLSNKPLHIFEESVRTGSKSDLLVLLFVTRKRTEPELTFSAFRDTPYHRLSFVDVERTAAIERALAAGADTASLVEMSRDELLEKYREEADEGKADPSDEGPDHPSA